LLLQTTLRAHIETLTERKIRLVVIGDRSRLPETLLQLIVDAERASRETMDGEPSMTLCVAMCYGSKNELAGVARTLAAQVREGTLPAEAITEAHISDALETRRAGVPDPDLVIRTGGERRLSGFLLWQAEYAELCFLDVLWPDFQKKDLLSAIRLFAATERRYGRTPTQVRQQREHEHAQEIGT